MNLSTITRTTSICIAACFVADAFFAMYKGHAINSVGVLLDAIGIMVFAFAALFVPMFFKDGMGTNNKNWPTPEPETDHKDCNQNIYAIVDAVRMLVSHPCVNEEQKNVLGDIVKCLLIKGNDSCEV